MMKHMWVDMSYEDMELLYDFHFKMDGFHNIKGNEVARDRHSYPYSYDPFAVWEGDYSETDHAVYSDRLMGWDFDKYNKCVGEVWGDSRQIFSNCHHSEIERFLSLYFDEPIRLTGIEQGCNVSNGYPYWIFYYKSKD